MLRYYSNTITKIVPSIFHLSLSLSPLPRVFKLLINDSETISLREE